MHVRFVHLIIFCFAAISGSGCAAIGTRASKGGGRPYAGVCEDAYYLANPSEADHPALQPLNVFDMPFSFIVDTFCLPYDLVETK